MVETSAITKSAKIALFVLLAIHLIYLSILYSRKKSAAIKPVAAQFEPELQSMWKPTRVALTSNFGEEYKAGSFSSKSEQLQTALEIPLEAIPSSGDQKERIQTQANNPPKSDVSSFSLQVNEPFQSIFETSFAEASNTTSKLGIYASPSAAKVTTKQLNVRKQSVPPDKQAYGIAVASSKSNSKISATRAHLFENKQRSESVLEIPGEAIVKSVSNNFTNLQTNGQSDTSTINKVGMEPMAMNTSSSVLAVDASSTRRPNKPIKYKLRAANRNSSQSGLTGSIAVAASHLTREAKAITQQMNLHPLTKSEKTENNKSKVQSIGKSPRDILSADKVDEAELCRSLRSIGKQTGRLGADDQTRWTKHRCAKRLTAIDHVNVVGVKMVEDKVQLLCENLKRTTEIIPMASWGKATEEQQVQWSRENCDCYFPESRQAKSCPPGIANVLPTWETYLAAALARSSDEQLPDGWDAEYPLSKDKAQQGPVIAVLVASTSRQNSWGELEESPLFKILLPSLLRTAETGYEYRVHVGYDLGDGFFDDSTQARKMRKWFSDFVAKPLWSKGIRALFATSKFENAMHKPGPVYNFLAASAKLDGADYLYRLNDYTEMLGPWTTVFIRALESFSPPRLGVVGPTCFEGIAAILPSEFVHRTHTDIFELFYPSELVDHLSQHWISKVYPSDNSKQLPRVVVRQHSYFTGRRYSDKHENVGSIDNAVVTGSGKIQQYIASRCDPSPCALTDFHTTPLRGAQWVGADSDWQSDGVQVMPASSNESASDGTLIFENEHFGWSNLTESAAPISGPGLNLSQVAEFHVADNLAGGESNRVGQNNRKQ